MPDFDTQAPSSAPPLAYAGSLPADASKVALHAGQGASNVEVGQDETIHALLHEGVDESRLAIQTSFEALRKAKSTFTNELSAGIFSDEEKDALELLGRALDETESGQRAIELLEHARVRSRRGVWGTAWEQPSDHGAKLVVTVSELEALALCRQALMNETDGLSSIVRLHAGASERQAETARESAGLIEINEDPHPRSFPQEWTLQLVHPGTTTPLCSGLQFWCEYGFDDGDDWPVSVLVIDDLDDIETLRRPGYIERALQKQDEDSEWRQAGSQVRMQLFRSHAPE